MTQTVTIHIVLLGTRNKPGEYEVLEGNSRAVLFGPFFGSPDSARVADELIRRLRLNPSDVTVEWR